MAVRILSPTRAKVYGRKGYWPEEPNRTQEYFRGPDAYQLAMERDEALRQRRRDKAPKTKQTSLFFETAIEIYLTSSKGRMTPATWNDLQYKLNGRLKEGFGNVPIDQISPELVDRYVNRRLQTVKAVTVNSELTYLKAILNWAVLKKHILLNPLNGYIKPRRDDARIMPPTFDEITGIVKHAPNHLKRALLIALFCGVRPGAVELLSIQWGDIDWTKQTIYIRSARKGGPSDRIVPLHPQLYECLNCWYEDDVTPKYDEPPPIIIHWHGKAVKDLRSSWATAKKKAGITRRLRFYDCRHAFASMLADLGHDLRTISELLGHSSPETTARIYRHTSMLGKRNAIDSMQWIGETS